MIYRYVNSKQIKNNIVDSTARHLFTTFVSVPMSLCSCENYRQIIGSMLHTFTKSRLISFRPT